jgi:hypothetical protein
MINALTRDPVFNIPKLLLLCLLVTSMVLVDAPRLLACSCALPGSPAAELAQATAVFAGVVTEVETPAGSVLRGDDPVTVTFQVAQVWKGPRRQTLTVTTASDSAACGYNFTVDEAYLVYAHGATDALSVSLCSRTAPLVNALADLYALGEGQQPQTEEQPTSTPFVSPLATPPATPTPAPLFPPVVLRMPDDDQEILTGDNIGFKVVGINRDRVEVILMVRVNGEWREADLAVQNFFLDDGR